MITQNYIIKSNPKNNPVYPYARTEYYFEIIDGDFAGIHFSFGEIDITADKEIVFDYNLLYIPEQVILTQELKDLIGNILLEHIERGNYELNTE